MNVNERPVSQGTLAELLRAAEKAHAEYEQTLGRRDDDWPEWYAHYIFERLPGADYVDEPEKIPSTEPFLNE